MQKKELYRRGGYYLAFDVRSDGTPRSNKIYIFWYDPVAGRVRSLSTRSADIEDGKAQLDQLYEANQKGFVVCPTCGQALSGNEPPLLATAVAEYGAAKADYKAASYRLEHVLNYQIAKGLESTRVDEVDDIWVDAFRAWALEVPITSAKGNSRKRTPGTVEASVLQLRAAVNHAFKKRKLASRAEFKVKSAKVVSKSPWFRMSEKQLVATFRYALVSDYSNDVPSKQVEKWRIDRLQLLQFLRLSVCTWARPDAVMDFSTAPARGQWQKENGYIDLNPNGRAQTKKYRPLLRAPRQLIPHLEANLGPFVKVASVRTAWRQMTQTLNFPQDAQSGTKLVRRSVSNLLRAELEHDGHWQQGRIYLGHVQPDESDKYATAYHTLYTSHALAATEALIDRIETAAPGAFSLNDTDTVPELEPRP
ncbi:hypothetical protein [Allopontixanthobacter sediminis]|uniref:Phage integrase family protein n=1 Tax=Allopontixanthobacter sediminis TaxID=1689985 RepID=A0A845AZY1_9SPHN|nr:hypothetical protein [Allopontixanthobacter sediminis]MXP44591.1 hypothetical protein [Allopontixanthobacter sediminis]